ncbi:MAG: PAS domain S-box protein [Candidatus Moranbacteria bacterium]|nr:PAS domain S-box protein [Candidatus Moranbacteria bacterium]
MTLRLKVFLIVGTSLLVFFLFINQVLSGIIARDFAELEKSEAEKNASRVVDALNGRMDALSVKVSDWAQWDDTYNFVIDGNQEYVQSNLQNEAFGLLQINSLTILDLEGKILFDRMVRDGETVASSPFLLEHITKDVVEEYVHTDGPHRELVSIESGPIMYVARPITTSDGKAPTNGFIIFGYFFDERVLAELSQVTHLDIEYVPYTEESEQSSATYIWKQVSSERPVFLENDTESEHIIANIFFGDAYKRPVFLLRVIMDRDVYERGQESIALFTKFMGLTIILFSLLLFFVLNRLVLRRLASLSRQVEKIGLMGDSQQQVSLTGKDEFSGLAYRINEMLKMLHVAEMNRKESEKRFRTLADSAPVLIWMTDSKNQCIYVNRRWLEYTGRTLEDELGMGYLEAIHPDDKKSVLEICATAFSKQQAFSMEYRLQHQDGTYGWVFSQAVAHLTSDDVFLGYIGSCIDITERKESENQNKNRIQEIERMNRIMVERELKMIELKEQIKKLQSHV